MRRLALCLIFISALPLFLASQEKPNQRLEILAVGDIMLGRGVATKIVRHGSKYLLAKLSLGSNPGQVLIGNLESPLSRADFVTTSPYRFKGDPAAAKKVLQSSGFRFLSLANNHALDCGLEGLYETRLTLDSLGIFYSGVLERLQPENTADSGSSAGISRPAIISLDERRIGFLAFGEPYLLAGASGENSEILAPADSSTIVNSIAAIKDSCSIVIVSFHWGYEYWDHPSTKQKYLGRLAIRAGAKIVHGHHPHVLQGVEFYRGGVIAYSLGNFIFDQNDSIANQSSILHITLKDAAIDSVWLQPIQIKEKRPVPMDKELLKDYVLAVKKQCTKLGSIAKLSNNMLILKPRS